MLLYLLSPIDLLPELLLGPAGYLDDVGFVVIVFLYTVANSAVEYVRTREWRSRFIGINIPVIKWLLNTKDDNELHFIDFRLC